MIPEVAPEQFFASFKEQY